MSWSERKPTLTHPPRRGPALEAPEEWAALRQECPVARATLPSGDEVALLTRYEDVRQVLADGRFTRRLTARDAARIAADGSGGVFGSDMATAIPDGGTAHRRWRRLVGQWLTAERVAALTPAIEARTERLVDGLTRYGHPADLRAHLAYPLPVWVMCELLGVPDADRDRFARWSDVLLNLTRYTRREYDAVQDAFVDYLGAQVHARQDEPTDDLLGALVTARDADGRTLSERELVFTGQALLVAGHETTMNVIAKMVALLLADRRHWERLLADRSLVPSAVEEVLRYDADPGVGMPRYLAEDAEIAGTLLPRGTTVLCVAAAANRDESAFEDPARMTLDRSPNHHLAFGAGARSCLGQGLARAVLRTVLDVLLRRLPTLELAAPAADLRRLEGLAVGGLSEVPVRW